MHHVQSCVVAPNLYKHKHVLVTHFLPHDIPNSAVSFPLFQTDPHPHLRPPQSLAMLSGLCVIRNTCVAHAHIEANMCKVVGSKHSPKTRRNKLTNMATVFRSTALTHTQTHIQQQGEGMKTATVAQLKQQCLFPGKMSGNRYW